jgi:hypothetical protein
MRPSFTAISSPQPFEHSRHAEWTQSSGSLAMPSLLSTLDSIACSDPFL